MGSTMQKVDAVSDDSGHWYIIPSESREDFRQVLAKAQQSDAWDAQHEFENKYGQYRTGGDLNNVQLYAEI